MGKKTHTKRQNKQIKNNTITPQQPLLQFPENIQGSGVITGQIIATHSYPFLCSPSLLRSEAFEMRVCLSSSQDLFQEVLLPTVPFDIAVPRVLPVCKADSSISQKSQFKVRQNGIYLM